MKSLVIAIVDRLFSAFIAFIVAFILLNFYLDRPLAIILSVIISLPVFFIALKRINEQRSLFSIKKQTQKKIDKTTCLLCFLEKSKLFSVFEDALTKKGYSVTNKKYGLLLESENALVIPIFNFDNITKTDVVKAYNYLKKDQTAYVFGNTITADLSAFIQRFNNRVVFIGGEKTYALLEQTACLPQNDLPLSINTLTIKKVISTLLSKVNSKKFLLFGMLFIAMSYFAPLKLYYVIIGALFLAFALVVRLFGRTTNAPNQ